MLEWSSELSPGAFLALALGLGALLLLARRFAVAPSARGLLLLALRAAVLIVLLVILLDPVRVTEEKLPPQPPTAVLLVDCSRSMGLERPSRLDRAKQFIAQAEARIAPDRRPRTILYGFGSELAAASNVRGLAASAHESRLRDALERLPALVADDPPRAVVVFSDGRTTETTGFAPLAEGYQRLKTPIHVVPLGDPRGIGDVAIQDVVVPREARSGTRFPVRVVIRSRGYPGERAEVRIRALSDPSGAPLASLPLTLIDGTVERELVVEADRAKGPLVVEIPPLAGETIVENNTVPFQVAARTGKIRVIYMEGTGSNEYHWIRDALIEDPNIECLALDVDNQYNQTQRLRRVGDPGRGYPATRAELFGYDVIICSDINRAAFTQQQLDWTVELVGKRGGGFAMIGGNTSFGAGLWDQTVWDGMIPIDMSGTRTRYEATYWNVILKVQVPAGVANHPIWRIVDDPDKNRAVLARMPVFYGTNLTDRLKPAATALGLATVPPPTKHPGPIPIFSCQSFGSGRSFALLSDSTVDWGRDFEKIWGEGDNRYFRKFWRNVVEWLAENSANANRRLQVETDKVIYHPGAPIELTAKAFDEHLEPTQRFRVEARLQGAAAAPLSPRAAEGDYQTQLVTPPFDELPAASPGTASRRLALHVTAFDGKTIVAQGDLDVRIIDDSPEYHDPRPDPARLVALAQASGGQVVHDPSTLADLLACAPASPGPSIVSKVPLWDHPVLWLLLLGLLTTEWIARRVKGLA